MDGAASVRTTFPDLANEGHRHHETEASPWLAQRDLTISIVELCRSNQVHLGTATTLVRKHEECGNFARTVHRTHLEEVANLTMRQVLKQRLCGTFAVRQAASVLVSA